MLSKNLYSALCAALVALFLCSSPGKAATCPSYPFTLQNGQVADANQVMANFNSVQGCVNTFIPSIQGSVQAVANIAALQAIGTGLSPQVYVQGYRIVGDGGGGAFNWNPISTASPDLCVVFQATGVSVGRWVRNLSGTHLTVKQCGAVGDSVTDDTAAEQAGINAIANGGVVNTIQSAPAGKLVWPAGTYKTTATLNIGPLANNNVGIDMVGDGRGAAVIAGNIAGPVFLIASTTAPNRISDMQITNNNNSGANTCITVNGNSTALENLWFNCIAGIDFEGATDAHVHNVLCDGCQGIALVIKNSHTIDIEDFEAFGSPSQFSSAVNCAGGSGTSYDITLSGLTTLGLGSGGVTVGASCTLTMSNYALNGAFGTYNSPATHRGITVNTGGILNLGVGTVTNWQAEGLDINNGTVFDTGASFSANVLSGTATHPTSVFGIDAIYIKSGGSIAGASGNATSLINVLANGDGILSIGPGVILSNAAGSAIIAQGTNSPMASINVIGVVFNGINQANNAAATPIEIIGSGVTAANISDNIIVPTFSVTAAVAVSAGTVNITNNLSHSGTFPATAGNIVSTNNRNF